MLRRSVPLLIRGASSATSRTSQQQHHRRYLSVQHHDEVQVERVNGSVFAKLNRPKALNALNLPMVHALARLIKQVDATPSDKLFVMHGEGEKAFCAGGDVVAIYHSLKSGGTLGYDFFHDEYKVDYAIATMRTPTVALLRGITMGGGMGLTINSKYRIATESTMCAMPETALGFFCDVGGSYFLPRLGNNIAIGMYYALTGARITGHDAFALGLATHFVPASKWETLHARLREPNADQHLDGMLAELHQKEPPKEPAIPWELINKHFGKESLAAVIDSLAADSSPLAQSTLESLRKLSPTALHVVFSQLQRGSKLSLKECFVMEFRMSQSFMRKGEFAEGVRALLVDKDKQPKWNPAQLEAVDPAVVESYFDSLGPNDLQLP